MDAYEDVGGPLHPIPVTTSKGQEMPRTPKPDAPPEIEPTNDLVDGRPPRGRYFVEALGRGLEILDCFTTGTAQLSLGEISERVGLGRGTTFRLLRTLEEAGYVYQNP